MDYSKVILVVSLTILIVVGFNLVIYFAYGRKNSGGTVDLLRNAAKRARDPWEQEDAQLQELSKRVAQLRKADGAEENGNDI